jgi:hypothetical protein
MICAREGKALCRLARLAWQQMPNARWGGVDQLCWDAMSIFWIERKEIDTDSEQGNSGSIWLAMMFCLVLFGNHKGAA